MHNNTTININIINIIKNKLLINIIKNKLQGLLLDIHNKIRLSIL